MAVAILVAGWFVGWEVSVAGAADDVPLLDRRSLDESFRAQLNQLAAKCDELELPEQAGITRGWHSQRDPRRHYVFRLEDIGSSTIDNSAADLVRHWHARFMQIRQEHAEKLFQLAQKLAATDRPARAYQLLHEVLRENPDHEIAKHILKWPRRRSAISARTQLRADQRFGWQPGRHWRIESEHFLITTNFDLEEATDLARRLEELYDVWQQIFFEHWSNQAVLKRCFDHETSIPNRSRRKHKVVLFPDRHQYLSALERHAPARIAARVGSTIGIYLYGLREAWFYGVPEDEEATWIHEVTHQLFHETTSNTAANVGGRNNFWIVEGIAMYMESMKFQGTCWTVGGFESDRLQLARRDAKHGRFYLPLKTLAALSSEEIQGDADRIRDIYHQSAGLAHFFMDHQGGRFRPLVANYLEMVYAGRTSDNTLERLGKMTFAQFDQQYQEFLQVRDVDLLQYLVEPSHVRRLVLGRTAVTDAGLAGLAACSNLESLDLTSTQTTDEGLQHLAGLTQLIELGLAQTSITNAGLIPLQSLKQLEVLDVRETAVTPEALRTLKNSLPELELQQP